MMMMMMMIDESICSTREEVVYVPESNTDLTFVCVNLSRVFVTNVCVLQFCAIVNVCVL